MNIREARVEDCEAIYQLNKNALGYDYDIDKTHQKLKRVLGTKNNKVFVAEVNGAVIGYIHAADYECTYIDSVKDILALAVAESCRGLGIGRSLLSIVEQWAKENGSYGIRLVSGFNRLDAHKFYLACGYKNRKDQKNFIKMFDE